MRVSTTALFQGLDGLRRHVYELEDALKASNDEVARLAVRVKALEDELASIEFVEEEGGLRSWIEPGSNQVKNTIFEKDESR